MPLSLTWEIELHYRFEHADLSAIFSTSVEKIPLSEVPMTLQPKLGTELAIRLSDGNTYIINLTRVVKDFYVKSLDGTTIQVSPDTAAYLFGAAQAVVMLKAQFGIENIFSLGRVLN